MTTTQSSTTTPTTTSTSNGARRDPFKVLRDVIDQRRADILAALPAGPRRLVEYAALVDAVCAVKGIDRVSPESVVPYVLQIARLGLTIDEQFGEAFLQVRKTREGALYLDLQIGYRGLRRMMLAANPDLRDVYARVVYEGEEFAAQDGTEPVVRHAINVACEGPLLAAYAVAVWRDGTRRIDVLGRGDVLFRHRDRSPGFQRAERDGTQDSPWHTDEAAMWRKSAIVELANSFSLRQPSDPATTIESPEERGRDEEPDDR